MGLPAGQEALLALPHFHAITVEERDQDVKLGAPTPAPLTVTSVAYNSATGARGVVRAGIASQPNTAGIFEQEELEQVVPPARRRATLAQRVPDCEGRDPKHKGNSYEG